MCEIGVGKSKRTVGEKERSDGKPHAIRSSLSEIIAERRKPRGGLQRSGSDSNGFVEFGCERDSFGFAASLCSGLFKSTRRRAVIVAICLREQTRESHKAS